MSQKAFRSETSHYERVLNEKICKNKEDGCNMAYLEDNKENTKIILDKIKNNHNKYVLLKQLESDKISMFEKLKRIEKNKELFPEQNPYITCLSAGGLFKDFDFDL
jgi:hypothetical protein